MGILRRLFGIEGAESGRVEGPGRFSWPIVGESFYQEPLRHICGPPTRESRGAWVEARVVLEDDNPHDPLAVRIEIGRETVGHLSRDNARLYRRHLRREGRDLPSPSVTCDAVIRGGWNWSDDRPGNYGVWLDLPWPQD